jgi:DNA (cytosine-5)-methyltransferase 1
MKFVDLFAGTGAMRLGFEMALSEIGMSGECVFTSEIDKAACDAYRMNFSEVPSGDIREHADGISEHDFLLAGFPCQPFSHAGKMKGFGDTRGTLFFEVERILARKRPRGFLLENVKGILTNDKGRTFETILARLRDLGYSVDYRVLNSCMFGVPQNRVRVFIFGVLADNVRCGILSDKGPSDSHRYKEYRKEANLFFSGKDSVVGDILEPNPKQGYWCSGSFTDALYDAMNGDLESLDGYRLIDYRGGKSLHSWDLGVKGRCTAEERKFMHLLITNRRKKKFGVHQDGKKLTKQQIQTFYQGDFDVVATSLITKGYLKDWDGRFDPVCGNMSFEVFKFLDKKGISITLTSSDAHKLGVVQDGKPRRITPREAARLQGFPDWFKLHPKDGKAYKQLGNAVSVPVVAAVCLDLLQRNEILTDFGMNEAA